MLIFWSYGKLKDVHVLKIWRYLSFWVDFRVSGGCAEEIKSTMEITFAGYGMAARYRFGECKI